MGDLYNPFPKLPKNIRQIGDTDQVVRFYVEDYVNTYLKRLYPTGKQTLRVGLLLGNVEQYDGTPYIFVDGAMEMEDVEVNGEKINFSDNAWKKAYQAIEEAFPKRTVQGWFLCGGPGSQLSPLNYWKQHGQYFAGKNQLMYLNHGLEGEEAVYVTSDDGFYRLKGYCVYYERNQMMQDYMITRKDVHRIESGSHEKVIKDFRQRMVVKKEQAKEQSHRTSTLGMICGMLSVAVLAGGVVLVNNYTKMQRMESVLTSVLPAGVSNWDEYQKQKAEEPDFVIEELPGNVHPIETAVGETGESYGTETMGSSIPEKEEAKAEDADSTLVEEAVPSVEGESADSGSTDGYPAAGESGQAREPEDVTPPVQTEPESQPEPESLNGGLSQEEASSQNLVGMGKGAGQGDIQEPEREPIDYAVAEANGYHIYEVGEGETLYGICWKNYDSLKHLAEICRLNNLEDEDRILTGQKLILP